jgi:predicted metal-binding membrane protein
MSIAGWPLLSSMAEMSMHGGAAASVPWQSMPAEGWARAAVSFLGMWIGMTVAMMLPSAIPMLGRYRRAARFAGGRRGAWLTALAGAGYWLVWTAIGAAVFPLDVALSALVANVPALARAAPTAAAALVVVAGAYQLTARKARQLACCREAPGDRGSAGDDSSTAWRHGVRLGLHCARSCANLMVIPLVLGVMDVRAMAVAGLVIAAERFAPAGDRIARGVGVVAVATGLVLGVRAA